MSEAAARARWLRRLRRNRNVVTGALIVVLVALAALFAEAISTHDPRRLNPANRLRPPTLEHYLGTDEFGRDVWSLVVHGSQVSLLVGATTMVLTSLGAISRSPSATSCRTASGRCSYRGASSSLTRSSPRRSWASWASGCRPTFRRGAT